MFKLDLLSNFSRRDELLHKIPYYIKNSIYFSNDSGLYNNVHVQLNTSIFLFI
jgi:hypothetical protein